MQKTMFYKNNEDRDNTVTGSRFYLLPLIRYINLCVWFYFYFLDVIALVGLSLESKFQRLCFSVNELFGGCPFSQVCSIYICRDLPSRFGQELHHEYWGDRRVPVCLSPRLQLPGGSELLQHHQGGRGKCWPLSWKGWVGTDLGGGGSRMSDIILRVSCLLAAKTRGTGGRYRLGRRMTDTQGALGCHLQKKKVHILW